MTSFVWTSFMWTSFVWTSFVWKVFCEQVLCEQVLCEQSVYVNLLTCQTYKTLSDYIWSDYIHIIHFVIV